MKNEGEKNFLRFARTDRRYAPLCTASGSVSYTVPPPFINPVSAPVLCPELSAILAITGKNYVPVNVGLSSSKLIHDRIVRTIQVHIAIVGTLHITLFPA